MEEDRVVYPQAAEGGIEFFSPEVAKCLGKLGVELESTSFLLFFFVILNISIRRYKRREEKKGKKKREK